MPSIAEHGLDLLAMALRSTSQDRPSLWSANRVSLARLKRVLRQHLRDADLRPSRAAGLAGISVRHANRLLAAEGTSLERLIHALRLEQCRLALQDPALEYQTISEIAFSWGFNDQSHFSRSFRAKFGLPPREWRKRSVPT
jgi:AraC-like DNA-binding protein